MHPSSTSSSETPEPRPRPLPLGALGAIVLLVIFDFAVVRQDWFWGWVPLSQGGVIDALEQEVLHDAEPKILLMGSSRVRDALAPRVVEKELGLEEGDVLNLGLTFGTPWDTIKIYERNRERLSSAKLAFFGVEPFQFNHYDDDSERVSRLGTLHERLEYFHGHKRIRKTLGYFWRALDAGPALDRFVKSWWKGRPSPPISDDGRIDWRTPEDNVRAAHRDAARDARRYFRSWRTDRWRQHQLRHLIRMLEADGMEVVVFQVPARDEYWDYVYEHYVRRLEYYIRSVRRAASGYPQWWSWRATEEGYHHHSFYDYGHMRDHAAVRYSRRFARRIRRSFGRYLGLPSKAAKASPRGNDVDARPPPPQARKKKPRKNRKRTRKYKRKRKGKGRATAPRRPPTPPPPAARTTGS